MSSVLPVPATSEGRAGSHRNAAPLSDAATAHRTDIEGLRGIAVLSVLAVHSFPQWIDGGFIGVDIFFVLSGFLISGILFRSLEAGRFNLADFYARRVRRIVPALCLVLLACMVFSVAFTYPSESRQIGHHVAAGALFISNLALWKEAGYFDVASEAKPLLHLWSLGIEEQFYIVWPLVVVVLFRHQRHALRLLCGLLLASFALNVAMVADRPVATFFLPPTRFWELMAGALLAWATLYASGGPLAWLRLRVPDASWWHRHAGNVFAAVGLSMLALAIGLIDKTDQFPGWWALLPTGGTVALLAAGPDAWINRRLLSQPILRFYGAISYPLYLWHWPLLCFPTVLGIALTNEVRVMILIASVVLAALTYELVEKPIRQARAGGRLTLLLVAALGVIGLCGWGLKQSEGLLDSYPPSVRGIAATEFRFDYAAYRIDNCMLRLEQGPESFSADCVDRRDAARPLTLLWGDSHAASLYPGLAPSTPAAAHAPRIAQYTAARCPPLMSPPPLASAHCARTNAYVLERVKAERPDTVVLAGQWLLYGAEHAAIDAHLADLRATVQLLQSLGVRKVVVFGQQPIWTLPPPRLLLTEWTQSRRVPERSFEHIDRRSLELDGRLRQAISDAGAVFVSPTEHLCDATGCLVSTQREGTYSALNFDDSHLTTEGSRVLIGRTQAAWLR